MLSALRRVTLDVIFIINSSVSWRASSRDCDTPGVYFVLCREIYPNLGCSVKISISLSRLSPFIKLLMNVHQILELFDLKNSQIWSLLKLLFLEENANSKVNLVSQLPSRLIYSDSRPLWCYLIYVRIRFLDSRSISNYVVWIRILQRNLCCANL